MPISRTVSGIIVFDELDEQNGWDFAAHASLDATTKYSGAASFKTKAETGYAQIYAFAAKNLNIGSGSDRVLHIWHKTHALYGPGHGYYAARIQRIVDFQNFPATIESADHDWAMHAGVIEAAITGSHTVQVAYFWVGINAPEADGAESWADRLVVAQSGSITVTGLTQGQKVEIYRSSDDVLIGTATCQAGQTTVTISVTNEDFPEEMYFKVYGTNGTTLIETTASYSMSGGDTWAWTPDAGTMVITVDADIIYRSAATGTPKTSNITANLKTPAGANYPGATIYFSTTLGVVTPSSDVTDADGNAHTALTSIAHGIAVITASWLGDGVVPACTAYYTVHVFYEAEAPDSDKSFQFYCQGIEYAYVGGRYTQNELGEPNDFEGEIPEWVSILTANGYVNIYRKGVKEFAGVLKVLKRRLDDLGVVLKGPDVSTLLNHRVVSTKIYSLKTPQYIINDLLTTYPCGITPGTLQSCTTTLTITIDTEPLAKAIPRICDLVYWHYRVNLDRTLDFADTFSGGLTAASFTEGVDLWMADPETNYYGVANYIRMRGDGITSTKQDGTKIQAQGLLQFPAFNKSISNQATLDSACQALLDMMKTEDITIPVEVEDAYAPGTFGPEDYITVTSASTGLSGTFQIRKITRDLSDPNFARMDLQNRTKEYWELEEAYRRMTKDVSVL